MPARLSVSFSGFSQVRSPWPTVKPTVRGGLTTIIRRCCTSLSSVRSPVFAASISRGSPSCSFLAARTNTMTPLLDTP